MFVTINIHEGVRYKVSEVKIVGNTAISINELEMLIITEPGDIFNLQMLTTSAELMKFRLSEEGYANAEIDPIPKLDYELNEASVTFFINSQHRVYVRRINFNGLDQVDDEASWSVHLRVHPKGNRE